MPENPGRLVVSEKLKPSGTTSTFTVSDNSFPLILVFGIINQLVHTQAYELVCAHLYRNPIHLLKHCSRHNFDCLKGNKFADSGRIAFHELQYKIILIFLILDAALQFSLSETNPLSLCIRQLSSDWLSFVNTRFE